MKRGAWLIGGLVVVAVVGGLAVYFRDFIQVSLLIDRPLRGAMWSAVVRHTINYQGDDIYCYDEGSQFCENVLANLTDNDNLRFQRSRTLGYAFSPSLSLGEIPHHTLYSCVNLDDAREGNYTYRISTDPADCNDIDGYPYPLGKVFTQPGDLEVPLPLHRQGDYLGTEDSTEEFILGYLSAVQINQEVPTNLGPREEDVDAFCAQVAAECSSFSADPLCIEGNDICDESVVGEISATTLDLNGDGCVGENDLSEVQGEVGTDATGRNSSSDVNEDGVIDTLDVMAVTRFLDDPDNTLDICDPATEAPASVSRDSVEIP